MSRARRMMCPPICRRLQDSLSALLTLGLRGVLHASGWWVPIGVDTVIANSDPILVKESKRLLQQPGRRCTCRHGSLQDIEAILVHVDHEKGLRSIGVGELYPASFDTVVVAVPVV